jgi:hypothetical protein
MSWMARRGVLDPLEGRCAGSTRRRRATAPADEDATRRPAGPNRPVRAARAVGENGRIGVDPAGDRDREEIAPFAAARIAAVRDDPAGRLALARSIYEEPAGKRSQRPRFLRAALAFMSWMARRGVLDPLDGERPGSRWWRAMNERLLRDSCEAFASATGRSGSPSTTTVHDWIAFIRRPTAPAWYRAHNASIVAAYLDHRDLAAGENRTERFFLNVVLARVLYAHALVAAPRLALGRLAALGPVLGDPRRATVDLFLAMGRVLPDEYPAEGELDDYLRIEHRLGRVLDYAVIQPRLRALYDWSARELGRPELSELLVDGGPAYTWSRHDGRAWVPPRLPIHGRALARLTAPRS